MHMFLLFALPVMFFAAALFCLVRNNWVFRQQTSLLNKYYETMRQRIISGEEVAINELWEHEKNYLTYGQMMWRFWVWDVEKLRKPGR